MKVFHPPFCARRRCLHHVPRSGAPFSNFISWGFYKTKAFGLVPRFRCLACGKTFSTQTFRVDYYAKKVLPYEDIARRLSSCESLSAIGRSLRASTDTISNRISRAARQALALESELASSRRPREDLAADGFESFCRSQYWPNNITLLVGAASQFVYASDHVTLRRKGAMRAGQKARRAELEKLFRPDPRGIERSFARIATEGLRVLSDEGRPSLMLWTDEHRAYHRAILRSPCSAAMVRERRLLHRTISSRAARTRDNPLFPVNYLDRELRKDLHEHTRETTCFGRNVNRQMERLAVYLHWHNFRKPHRARGDPRSNAEVAGYEVDCANRAIKAMWKERRWLTLTTLTETMRDTWLRIRPTPLRSSRDYLPQYAFM